MSQNVLLNATKHCILIVFFPYLKTSIKSAMGNISLKKTSFELLLLYCVGNLDLFVI